MLTFVNAFFLVNNAMIVTLEAKVKSFLDYVVGLNPSLDLSFKHHVLTHYPRVLRESGPLCHIMTMRKESKHGELKGFQSSSRNYINPALSLSKRHQLKFAYNYLKSMTFKNFLTGSTEAVNPVCVCKMQKLNEKFNNLLASTFSQIEMSSLDVCLYAAVEIDGITFNTSNYIFREMTDNIDKKNGSGYLPRFSIIEEIFTVEDNSIIYLKKNLATYIVVRDMETVKFERAINCYRVSKRKTDNFCVLAPNELGYHKPLQRVPMPFLNDSFHIVAPIVFV